MPLPIPDILENASKVIRAAEQVCSDPTSRNTGELKDVLKKVSEQDLLAVMNEVGAVYMGVNNLKILSIGSRPNMENKTLEIAIVLDFGLGPRTFAVGVDTNAGQDLVKRFQEDICALEVQKGGLITDTSLLSNG